MQDRPVLKGVPPPRPLFQPDDEESAREAMDESLRALEATNQRLRSDMQVLVGLVQRLRARDFLWLLVPTRRTLAGAVFCTVPQYAALLGSVVLVGGVEAWEVGAVLCAASVALWFLGFALQRKHSIVGGLLGAAVVGGCGAALLGLERFELAGVVLLALPLLYGQFPYVHAGGLGEDLPPGPAEHLIPLACALAALGLMFYDQDQPTAAFWCLIPAGLLLLVASVGTLDKAQSTFVSAPEGQFLYLQRAANTQLDSINLLVDKTKAKILADPGMAAVVDVASYTAGAAARQRLPLWWHALAPLRWLSIVLGSLVFFLPDGAACTHSPTSWKTHPTSSIAYRLFTRPWVWLLVTWYRRSGRAATRVLDSELEHAQDALGAGVRFIPVPVKRRGRALVKVRDDYLAEFLPTRDAFVLTSTDYVWEALGRLVDAFLGWHSMIRVVLAPVLFVLFVVARVLRALTALALIPLFALEVALTAGWTYAQHVGGSTTRLVDMARTTLVCDSPEHMLRVHKYLISQPDVWEVVRIKNGWANKGAKGYAHVIYNVRLRGSLVVCEVQVTHVKVYQWRQYTHLPYKVLRADNMYSLAYDVHHHE